MTSNTLTIIHKKVQNNGNYKREKRLKPVKFVLENVEEKIKGMFSVVVESLKKWSV